MADCHHMQSFRTWGRRLSRVLIPTGMYVVLASFSPAAAAPDVASPVAPLARLKAGNDRFVRGTRGAMLAEPSSRVAAETPFAMVLSCADARMAPDLMFNTAPGELYVVRSLGAVVDRSVLASLEYGVDQWHTTLLVVMGHDSCAAVKAAHGDSPSPSANLEFLYKAIRGGQARTPGEQHDLRAAILANVEEVINDALDGSPLLRAAASAGQLQIVGAYYDGSTGTVVFSEPVGATSAAHR